MENFDNIPSNSLKVEVTHLINKLASNAGLYDSDEVSGNLRKLRMAIQKNSQKQLRRLEMRNSQDIWEDQRASGIGTSGPALGGETVR